MKPSNAATRTAVQAVTAFIVSGGIVELWNILVEGMTIEPTARMAIAFVLTWLVTYAQNNAEAHGHEIPGLTKLKNTEGHATNE